MASRNLTHILLMINKFHAITAEHFLYTEDDLSNNAVVSGAASEEHTTVDR